MNPQKEPDLKVALKHWEMRQKRDGYLMWIMVVVSFFLLVNYIAHPGDGSKSLVILALCGVVLSSLRLLKSSAKVVVLRRLVRTFTQ